MMIRSIRRPRQGARAGDDWDLFLGATFLSLGLLSGFSVYEGRAGAIGHVRIARFSCFPAVLPSVSIRTYEH